MIRRPVVAIIGSGKGVGPAVSDGRELGRLIAEKGWILISGGRDAGVMKSANAGAKEAGGLTIGILPNREPEVSPNVDVAVITDTGEARNNIIVLSADVVVACGVDDPGTASEVALALKAGKPVILLGASEAAREFFAGIGGENVLDAQMPEEAIEEVELFLETRRKHER